MGSISKADIEMGKTVMLLANGNTCIACTFAIEAVFRWYHPMVLQFSRIIKTCKNNIEELSSNWHQCTM